MYQEDTFFTLSSLGQVGLACLSATLAALVLWFVWRTVRHKTFYVRILIVLLAFYLFAWCSPQIYYTYYRLLFDGLPWQNVIKAPPSPMRLIKLISFQENASLSAYSVGLLGWALIALALLPLRSPK